MKEQRQRQIIDCRVGAMVARHGREIGPGDGARFAIGVDHGVGPDRSTTVIGRVQEDGWIAFDEPAQTPEEWEEMVRRISHFGHRCTGTPDTPDGVSLCAIYVPEQCSVPSGDLGYVRCWPPVSRAGELKGGPCQLPAVPADPVESA